MHLSRCGMHEIQHGEQNLQHIINLDRIAQRSMLIVCDTLGVTVIWLTIECKGNMNGISIHILCVVMIKKLIYSHVLLVITRVEIQGKLIFNDVDADCV